jgi:signal recognition particle receptor subunit beta
MVVFNYSGSEINAKIVYYGPALGGKTTNLEHIYERMPADAKGKMVSMKTRTDRTLFFDFLPIELGAISGFKTRMLLYTVPGQVYYNATRKLVLKGADAVVFVADSDPAKLKENIESLRNLEENLNEHDLTLDTVPWVIQYNKRDLPDAMPVSTLEAELNLLDVPSFEGIATQGTGVYETFQALVGMLYNKLAQRLEQSGEGTGAVTADPQFPASMGEEYQIPVGGSQESPAVNPVPAAVAQSVVTPAGEKMTPVMSPASDGDATIPAVQTVDSATAVPPAGPDPYVPNVPGGPPAVEAAGQIAPAGRHKGNVDSTVTATPTGKHVDDIDPSVSAALDSALREVDDFIPDPSTAAGSSEQVIVKEQRIERRGHVDESESDTFRFESLEQSRMDENVGRVLDLDETPVEPIPTLTTPDSSGEFITNPCTTSRETSEPEEESSSNSVIAAQESTLDGSGDTHSPPAEDAEFEEPRDTRTPPAEDAEFEEPGDTRTPPAEDAELEEPRDTRTPPAEGAELEEPRDTHTPQAVAAEREAPRDTRTRLAEVTEREARDAQRAQSEDECFITVPVLLTRSQIRKTIPIKLSLEIQIVDDDL